MAARCLQARATTTGNPNNPRREVTVTTQTTDRAATTSDMVQRNSFMTALSVAEQLVSETAALPNQFEVVVYPWAPEAPELRFYFHLDIPALRQFRDAQMLTERMETRKDGSVYVEASRGDVGGVRVVAWTLTNPPADTGAVTA